MAPASVSCQRNEDDDNVTSLSVVDLGTHVIKNISLLYNNVSGTADIQEQSTGNGSLPGDDGSSHTTRSMTRLHEFQIIKAVVLAAVTVVILISICKMVFQLFVRYTVNHNKN